MNESVIELLEIILSGDIDKNSFYVRNNFKRFQSEFPFLHSTIGVKNAVQRILAKSEDESLIKLAINKIGDSEKHKYTSRNYSLILADFYLKKNNLIGLETIINELLKDEFKFHGYRKLLLYYSTNYNENKFLDVFKKIEKRNSLNPDDRNAINTFIEKYSSSAKSIDQVKELVRKNKIYPQIGYFIKPMVLGHFGNQEDFHKIEKLVNSEIEDECERFSHVEDIYNELYERSENNYYKLQLLTELEDLSQRVPKELKAKGYPSKLWTLFLWRVGCKYLDLNKREKVERIIKMLTGKNKSSLKRLYNAKYDIGRE